MAWLRRRNTSVEDGQSLRTDPTEDETMIREALTRLLAIAGDPTLSDWDWVEVLASEGVDQKVAIRLAVFAPIAFGRAQLADREFTFSPMYEVRADSARTKKPLPLAGALEFVVAEEVARLLDHNDPGFQALAFRGAEMACVRQLERERNAPVNRLVFTDALIMWDVL